jgi:hypothetical protein
MRSTDACQGSGSIGYLCAAAGDTAKSLLLVLVLTCLANAQSDPRNGFTFSGGYARSIHSSCCATTETAASLGATYGYRVFRNLEIEAGVVTALYPTPEIRGANYDIKPNDRFIWVPFGLRGILPLHSGRIELSAAAGGLYEKYSVSNPNSNLGLQSRAGWGGYFAGGAAMAIDRGRHFWLGASPRWFLANANQGFGYQHDRWFAITGDFSVRF